VGGVRAPGDEAYNHDKTRHAPYKEKPLALGGHHKTPLLRHLVKSGEQNTEGRGRQTKLPCKMGRVGPGHHRKVNGRKKGDNKVMTHAILLEGLIQGNVRVKQKIRPKISHGKNGFTYCAKKIIGRPKGDKLRKSIPRPKEKHLEEKRKRRPRGYQSKTNEKAIYLYISGGLGITGACKGGKHVSGSSHGT